MATPIFVTAASIAAELHQAMLEAKGLALTAKNARALPVRAGSKTVGFKAITHFIDELASHIIRQSQYISGVSEHLSHNAVALWRASTAAEKFDWIATQHSDHIASLHHAMQSCYQQREALSTPLNRRFTWIKNPTWEKGEKTLPPRVT